MADDLTLPGEIPGLLRRGSPVCHKDSGERGILLDANPSGHDVPAELLVVAVWWEWSEVVGNRFLDSLALDLTSETGRAHAAWWLLVRDGWGGDDLEDLHWLALEGRDMTPDEIRTLRDLCLRLAKVTP